ncbi:hypothetical protein SOASR030_13500 [Leminorella grimontii]|uniref:Uncharacterized protein n=1 Tax=Leminorella grimontii TaxID=82981 RepID=A0AAV5N2X4_9GAMM|nr:hypothetical protein SOASR030_13500 [Leminorella grimontii]
MYALSLKPILYNQLITLLRRNHPVTFSTFISQFHRYPSSGKSCNDAIKLHLSYAQLVTKINQSIVLSDQYILFDRL